MFTQMLTPKHVEWPGKLYNPVLCMQGPTFTTIGAAHFGHTECIICLDGDMDIFGVPMSKMGEGNLKDFKKLLMQWTIDDYKRALLSLIHI